MPFFSTRKKDEIAYIFSVTSDSVSAALVKFHQKSPAKILYSTKKEIGFNSSSDFSLFERQTIEALKFVAAKIRKEGFLHLNFSGDRKIPSSHYCFLGAPWVESELKVLHYEKPSMFFSKTLLDSIVGREEDSFEKVSLSKFHVKLPEDLKLIEKKTLSVELNGYSTNNPFGKTADTAEISVFLSIGPKNSLQKFESLIAEAFGENLSISFQSLTLASSSCLVDMGNEDDYTIVDVTGELSEITVVTDGLITEIISFPLAKNGLIRFLAKKFATTPLEVVSIIKMHNDNALSPALSEKIRASIEEYGQDFVSTLNSIVTLPIAGKIFFITDPDLEEAAKLWARQMKNSRPIILEPLNFEPFVKGAKGSDLDVAIPAMFLNKLFNLQKAKIKLK